MRRVLQSPRAWAIVATAGWLLGAAIVMDSLRTDPGHVLAVYVTAWCAAALWVATVAQMLRLPPADWRRGNGWFALLRLTWVLGVLAHLSHMAIVFDQLQWSHAAAYEHTLRGSGVGEGIYVNYLFGLVWTLDAAWLTLLPTSYARRPRAVGWAVHGFLAFILFNATVVYGQPMLRWGGVLCFTLLGVYWIRRVRADRAGRSNAIRQRESDVVSEG